MDGERHVLSETLFGLLERVRGFFEPTTVTKRRNHPDSSVAVLRVDAERMKEGGDGSIDVAALQRQSAFLVQKLDVVGVRRACRSKGRRRIFEPPCLPQCVDASRKGTGVIWHCIERSLERCSGFVESTILREVTPISDCCFDGGSDLVDVDTAIRVLWGCQVRSTDNSSGQGTQASDKSRSRNDATQIMSFVSTRTGDASARRGLAAI